MELVVALCSRFMAAFGASIEMVVSHAGAGRTLAVSLCFGLQVPPSC